MGDWTSARIDPKLPTLVAISPLCQSIQFLLVYIDWFYSSSDGRVVRASASGAVDLGLITSRVKPMTIKLVGYSQLPCLTLSIKGTVRRTSRLVYLLCRWERHLARFTHLGEVDRWLATPKRARKAH